uniref:RING-type domain-containing protein n=1 Tax=Ditylenchus dipsaci TaxID=166011 RepID=A0A915E245_9BILA
MMRVHMQDGLDTLEELRTENFKLRQTSESRLASLNSTVQVKQDLQNVVTLLREQNKRLEDEKERQSREHCCVICLDAKREILFMPCLHFNTCEPCSKTSVMTHCGTCRQMIMGKLKTPSSKYPPKSVRGMRSPLLLLHRFISEKDGIGDSSMQLEEDLA